MHITHKVRWEPRWRAIGRLKSKRTGVQMPDLYKTTRFSQTGFATFLQTYKSIILPMALHRGSHDMWIFHSPPAAKD
jgi:hypothetical protein